MCALGSPQTKKRNHGHIENAKCLFEVWPDTYTHVRQQSRSLWHSFRIAPFGISLGPLFADVRACIGAIGRFSSDKGVAPFLQVARKFWQYECQAMRSIVDSAESRFAALTSVLDLLTAVATLEDCARIGEDGVAFSFNSRLGARA